MFFIRWFKLYGKLSLIEKTTGVFYIDGSLLYVADSESSTIRSVSTVNGAVKGVVGGALDPMVRGMVMGGALIY